MIWRRSSADAAEQLRRVQAVTDAALSALDIDELLTELLHRTRDLLSVDTAGIMLLDPTGRELVATAASGLEEEVREGIRVPVGEGFSGLIAASAEPATIDHVDQETVYSQVLIDKHLAAMAGVPMSASGRLIGVLHVGTLTPRKFSDDDIELLRLVADRASLASQAALSRTDRVATLALQRSLLPVHPPQVAGLQAAARYIPGSEVGVGGDWYDVFELPSGHVGVVIGDVAGSGLRAAVVMGRIRSALRAYALETDDPADVLFRLDRKIQAFEPGAMATVLYAVIDPSRQHAVLSSAGHLPALLLTPDDCAALFIKPDLPLGAYPAVPRHGAPVDLPADAGLLFYTDGLIERRDENLRNGIERLRQAVTYGRAEQMCASAIAILREHTTADDVAVVAVRRLDADAAAA